MRILKFMSLIMRMSFKMLTLSLISASSFLMTQTFAAPNKAASEENIDVTQEQISIGEIATVYHLSLICPSLIDDKDSKKFKHNYDIELKKVLPNEANPQEAIKQLSKQKEFKTSLKQIQADSKRFGDKENKEMCQEVVDYNY